MSDDTAPRPLPTSPPAVTPPEVVAAGVPRWAVIGIFIMLLVFGLAYARSFLMPVVLALLLKMVFSPVIRGLERVGIPSGYGALTIVGGLVAGLVAAVVFLSSPVSEWVNRAPMIGREVEAALGDLRWATDGMREAAKQMEEITGGTEDDPEVQRVVIDDSTDFVGLAMTVPQVLVQLFFTLILLFFLLASGDMFYEKLVHVMPTFRDKRLSMRITYEIERKLSHYLSTITFINAGLGVAIGTMMWLYGMPNPILFGVLAFALNFIPYVGAVTGVFIASVVALVSLPQPHDALLVGLTYFLLTSIEGQLITPYLVGRRLRLNTVVVFISITLFAWLWSVVGMLVAMPLLLAIRTLCEHIPTLQPLGDFLSARGAERERTNGEGEGSEHPPANAEAAQSVEAGIVPEAHGQG